MTSTTLLDARTVNVGGDRGRRDLLTDIATCLSKNGIMEEVPGDRVVDDLLIYVGIREIDGPAGVFGGAGPCQIREGNSLPAVGVMYFDHGDTEGLEFKGHLEGTIPHEMAHVIGFGTLWNHLGLLRDPAGHGHGGSWSFAWSWTATARWFG